MSESGFLASLFDLSFSEFIAARIIKVVYVLMIATLGLLCLSLFAASAFQSFSGFFGALVGCPLLFVVGVIYIRVCIELTIVIFRIAENIQVIADAARNTGARSPVE